MKVDRNDAKISERTSFINNCVDSFREISRMQRIERHMRFAKQVKQIKKFEEKRE
ncbi:hypothetical protein XSR1_70109 [Xenorhabdus szentirmaii DSM 16338]|uniref:Uncharacterized protein n=1 Tax=Xenorhabdus szentirmaii DSM 16338 TaxID=1427518 RepID=W1J7A6_9GAMM|nr:hypothetical protein XSR1_70109 [Xenorhabdus szentirmaii DSM 16338]